MDPNSAYDAELAAANPISTNSPNDTTKRPSSSVEDVETSRTNAPQPVRAEFTVTPFAPVNRELAALG